MPSFFQRVRDWVARRPVVKHVRLYSGAKHTQSTFGFGGGVTSEDAELATSLPLLRSRSRQLMRDSSYAKRARTVTVNNVIGHGIPMQAQVMTTRKKLAQAVNDDIEWRWHEWMRAANCHTGGTLHFYDLERAAMAEVFSAGEVLIRKHRRPFGDSKIPLALEVIEAERLAEDLSAVVPSAAQIRMGVEVDDFGRPVAYWIKERHPGDTRWAAARQQKVERVPAADIFHLKTTDRWPQTRGVPWLHTTLRKLDDMDQYSSAELQAARASSYYFGTIESPESTSPLATIEAEGAMAPTMEIESGLIQQLAPGEKLNFHSPSRPNTAIDPFIRHMLREVAAGSGVSYESLSRDYSQSNYSSSRLALLDDRDLWRMLQQWWIRSFREPLHREWLQLAVMAGAIKSVPVDAYLADRERYSQVLFKPRGWQWVDPTKEVNAYKEAVKAGFMTVSEVIAQTGGGLDLEDVLATRRRELDMMAEAGLAFDTDAASFDEVGRPVKDEPEKPDEPENEDDEEPQARLFSFGR